MEVNDKLDKIIDLLVSQNNLLTSIMVSLRTQQPNVSDSHMVRGPAGMHGNDIRPEIEKRIEAARREAQAKISQMQAAMPEANSLLKTE